jgi:C-terminal processing protease CtpA/Prc
MRNLVAIIALLLLTAAAPADHSDDQTGDQPLDERVQQLVDQLGHSSYTLREQAQRRLQNLPVEAVPLLADHYHATEDAEVRMRLRLHATYVFDQYVVPDHPELRRPGFLGVGQTLVSINGQPHIVVSRIVPGSGADRAGLALGDQIIALNDQPVVGIAGEVNPVELFSQRIKAHSAGQTVTITVLRDGNRRKLTATLGELPVRHMSADVQRLARQRRQAVEQQWFEQSFLAGRVKLTPPADPPDPDPTPRP